MKATAILGSRDEAGQTAQATDGLLRGLESEGVECLRRFLPTMRLESCRQCEADGWGICATEGRCVIEDDLQAIAQDIKASDIVVFATPVYYGDLSESMKVLTDRLRRVYAKLAKQTGERPFFKPTIGICVAGGGGGGAETCGVSLKKVLTTCGFEVITMEPVRRQNLRIKTKMLELLGAWLPEHVRSGEWERAIPRPSGTK